MKYMVREEGAREGTLRSYRTDGPLSDSGLNLLRDSRRYPVLDMIRYMYKSMYFYREIGFPEHLPPRRPGPADAPNDFLLPDASNLGLVLSYLQNTFAVKRLLIEKLQRYYDRMEDVTSLVQGGTVQVFFHERGLLQPISAQRVSDGTLRFLCLLTILLHPSPPPLICIEEPELGLHPDILPTVAELLIDASTRTQLIVTTHSETLVSALSEVPEAVVVCERDDDGTHLRRLQPNRLTKWLEKYTLGHLWRMGEIGGNRW
jgi:predicted ATPase